MVQIAFLTFVTMLAFAGNSVICRLALDGESIDPATFTTLRLASGAITLWLVLWLSERHSTTTQSKPRWSGHWPSAIALLAYAAGFSLAYQWLTAATGALLLFGAVQITMIIITAAKGNPLSKGQWFGFTIALGGLTYMLLPGVSAPPALAATLMIGAGIAWGIYTWLGKTSSAPLRSTAINFIYAAPLAALINIAMTHQLQLNLSGLLLAILSGSVTSGLGYALWYSVLPRLSGSVAASIQLSVPVITALGGALWIDEAITWHLITSAAAILGGIALVIRYQRR